jgi:hypothetical protein
MAPRGKPKPRIFTAPSKLIITFAGVSVPWTTPARCAREACGELLHDFELPTNRQRGVPFDNLAECLAAHILHHDEGIAIDLSDFVDRGNVAMPEMRHGSSFLEERLRGLLTEHTMGKDFEDDHAFEHRIAREIDRAERDARLRVNHLKTANLFRRVSRHRPDFNPKSLLVVFAAFASLTRPCNSGPTHDRRAKWLSGEMTCDRVMVGGRRHADTAIGM